ncbi:unnamed protein product [Tilletia controversa]|uniref:Uncharacterized protein n=3 Tax=Tilletia TaxID=13289 RepID=A0A8X7MXR5_9BASI|nr:hypothetical protein CF336_g1111 [Tilletia laevis]KAE8204518.1 hypothetical protein CF328_g1040 [Tilletia controversa]KAE8264794.1 hypothetical protein A4X03_0g700 [Tilletia caries]KAE8253550.1 hypothetical protein A4X06_0g1370 [Tilletia controversa]CAD6889478.1 unnamed protein product [Tilletia caries]
MLFKSSRAVFFRSTSNDGKKIDLAVLPHDHKTSGQQQLPPHLCSYVHFCAYLRRWEPSLYAAGDSCPPPPRGTLNDSKLAYLDWRLALIKFEREMETADLSVAVQHVEQKLAQASINLLEVPKRTLCGNLRAVQRITALPPRPHSTDGSIITYVPRIPGRVHLEEGPQIPPKIEWDLPKTSSPLFMTPSAF